MIVCYCLRASFILLALQSSPVCHFPLSPAAAARVLAAHVFVTLNPLRVSLTPLEVFFKPLRVSLTLLEVFFKLFHA
jgi:hypothetical protein